jgi:hypothetical protein
MSSLGQPNRETGGTAVRHRSANATESCAPGKSHADGPPPDAVGTEFAGDRVVRTAREHEPLTSRIGRALPHSAEGRKAPLGGNVHRQPRPLFGPRRGQPGEPRTRCRSPVSRLGGVSASRAAIARADRMGRRGRRRGRGRRVSPARGRGV